MTEESQFPEKHIDFLTAGFDTYLAYKFNVQLPVTSLIKQASDLIITSQLNFTLKKYYRFFSKRKTTDEEVNHFFQKIGETKKDELIDTMLFKLNQFDDINKVDILQNLYDNAIRDNIELEDYRRLLDIINKAYCNDLINLNKYYIEDLPNIEKRNHKYIAVPRNPEIEMMMNNLTSLGLIKQQTIGIGSGENPDGKEPTEIGLVLIKNGF